MQVWSKRNSSSCLSRLPKTLRAKETSTKIGKAINNISVMLRGKPHGKQGKTKGWTTNRDILNAALDFAEALQRFQSRAPERSQNRNQRQRNQHRP
jgi:hypothetical protein